MVLAASAVIAVQAVGAVVSVANRWPAQFGGPGDPDAVAIEIMTRGGPFTAPFPLLAIYSIAVAGSMRPGTPGKVSSAIVAAVSGVFVVGFAGEALSPFTGQVPRWALWTGALVGTPLSAFAGALAVRRIRRR